MSDNATAGAPSAGAESNTSESSESQGGESQNTSQQSAPKQKAPSFRKIKAGNEELTLSDDDIAREYSKWKGADAKFRDADQARKSVEAFMRALQENPESILNDKRVPITKQARQKLAQQWLREQIEEELRGPADPRDQKLSEYERQLQAYKDKEAQEKQSKEEQEQSAATKASMDRIGKTLSEAGKLSHLSSDPESEAALIREMALYMRAARERDQEVTPQEVVEHIHNQRFRQFYALAQQFEGDELLDFLGEEVAKRVGRAHLARLKSSRGESQSHKSESWTPKSAEKPTRMDPLTARDHARKVLFGK